MVEKSFAKPLPHNINAERAVLGALLLRPEAINEIADLIQPEDFYHLSHSIIFITLTELYEEEQTFDLITLTNRLTQKKKLDEAGGVGYLASLIEAVPTALNIVYHAEIVSKKALSRKLLVVSNKVVYDCFEDSESITSVLDRAEQEIFKLGEQRIRSNVSHVGQIITNNLEKLEKLYQRKETVTGISSGFLELDKLTSGFQNSDMIIIAARPSVGKTSLLLNMAQYIAINEKQPILLFSLEMSKEAIGTRLLSSMGKLKSEKLRTGNLSQKDWDTVSNAASELYKAPIYIDETANISVLELRAKARRMKNIHDIAIIFIDYLQLMKAAGRIESRQQEIAQISSSLKALAKEINVPIVVCSQLSRDIEKRREKKPRLSDLRESGSIEQDADVIGFLYRDDDDQDVMNVPGKSTNINLLIAKQRNGPTGNVPLLFFNQITLFRSKARNVHSSPKPVSVENEDEDEPPY